MFAALVIALNLSPAKLPAPYAPYLIYQIWEIPIVTVFLLYGAGAGFLVAVVNTCALMAFYPGGLPTGPLYNLAAVLSMLLGIGLTKIPMKKLQPKHEAVAAALLTASGLVARTIFMSLVNWAFLRFPPPVGYGMPEPAIVAAIPLIAVFNLTLALYTIPTGYYLARVAKPYVKDAK